MGDRHRRVNIIVRYSALGAGVPAALARSLWNYSSPSPTTAEVGDLLTLTASLILRDVAGALKVR